MDLLPELKRHSPSQLNSFLEYRTGWYFQRLLGKPFIENFDTARGKAIEDGINFFINGVQNNLIDAAGTSIGSIELGDCIGHAVKQWQDYVKTITNDSNVDKAFDYLQTIGPCVNEGIASIRDKYNPMKMEMQREINGVLPGCEKPVYGKLDYYIEGKVVIDNKVSSKTPDFDKKANRYKLKQGYIIQGAVYNYFTELPVEFHYIVPLKSDIKTLVIKMEKADYKYGMGLATKAAQAIETIYANLPNIDGKLLDAFFMCNPSSYWNAEEANIAREHFGLNV